MLNCTELFRAQLVDLERAVADAAKPLPPPDPKRPNHGGARPGAGRKARLDDDKNRQRVVAILREHGPCGPQLVSELTGMVKSTARRHLLMLVEDGEAMRVRNGSRYEPYRLVKK